LLGGLQRRLLARLDDLAGDAPAEALFAITPDQVGQVPFPQVSQQGAGRLALGGSSRMSSGPGC
jgi:hypothetical protein